MDDKKLEQELTGFDFSLCHSVRERLLDKLLTMQRMANAHASLKSQNGKWAAARMEDDDLDWVAAAGTGESQDGRFQKARKEEHRTECDD